MTSSPRPRRSRRTDASSPLLADAISAGLLSVHALPLRWTDREWSERDVRR